MPQFILTLLKFQLRVMVMLKQIHLIMWMILSSFVFSLNLYAEPNTMSEKEKALKLKEILSKHPMSLDDDIKEKKKVAFCQQFYKALKNASPKINYIEPVVRTDDINHPALSKYLACDKYEPKTAYVYFVTDDLGRRGFRLYRTEMDGHKENGMEEYLYGEDPFSTMTPSSAKLVKADLEHCIVRESVPASPENPVHDGRTPSYGFSSLVQFQKQFYWYDFHRIGTTEDYYSIHLYAYRPEKPKERIVEIEKDIFIHYRKMNVFGGFSFPSICNWEVPHNLFNH